MRKFNVTGVVIDCEPVIAGLCNRTFRVTVEDGGRQLYILQAINKNIFKNPELVMENIVDVTEHLRKKVIAEGGDPSREVLHVIEAVSGKPFHIDGDGDYWRLYNNIGGATAYNAVETETHMYNAGEAFGRFQMRLADYPIGTLHDTIPDFHNTRVRLDDFFAAVKTDKNGRVADLSSEIAFFRDRYDEACRLSDMQKSGELPTRVTHNDTKFNNVLIDDATGRVLCVIDLDTVMPGLSVYDFGDAVRFAASTAAEDEPDTGKVGINLRMYEQFAAGFVGATTGFLTDAELLCCPLGAKTIAIELASRFLKDYIEGDWYFTTTRPNHNLERARAQIALALDMERHFDEMVEIVKKYM